MDNNTIKKKAKPVLLKYIFNTQKELEEGLMDRKKPLTKTTVALFIYPQPQTVSMWMKNTYDSLDIIFLDSNRIIKCIHVKTVPLDLTPIKCNEHIKYVIEALAGYVENMEFKIGDQLIFEVGAVLSNNDKRDYIELSNSQITAYRNTFL